MTCELTRIKYTCISIRHCDLRLQLSIAIAIKQTAKCLSQNRKPVCGLSKTENRVLTEVPGFANPTAYKLTMVNNTVRLAHTTFNFTFLRSYSYRVLLLTVLVNGSYLTIYLDDTHYLKFSSQVTLFRSLGTDCGRIRPLRRSRDFI